MFYIVNSPNVAYTVSSLITVWNQAVNKQKEGFLQTMQHQAKTLPKLFLFFFNTKFYID